MKRVALVTGGNRGLGLAACQELLKRDYEVVLTARDETKGKKLASELGVHFLALDVSSPQSIDRVGPYLTHEFGRLDVLINNAGILPERGSAFDAKWEDFKLTVETNTYAPFLLCQKLVSLMKKNKYGRIVNVSSGMGQLKEMGGNYISYRVSKTALNAITKVFAEETRGTNILINSVCPGWVQTDMGGKEAARTLEQGVAGIIWAATLPDDGPTGGFYRDGKPLEW